MELPEFQAPAAALAGTAVGEQTLIFHPDCCFTFLPYGGGGTRQYHPWVFMQAFKFDTDNRLSQGWATGYTISEDGKTYTIHINPDAVFTDGTKLTAAAAKASYEFPVWPENQFGWGGSILISMRLIEGSDAVINGDSETISGIVVVDDETLEFNLKGNTPTWPGRLAVWLNGMCKVDGAYDNAASYFENPVGVGPYTSVGDPDAKTITLSATDNYWGDPPIIQSVFGTFSLEDSVRLLLFENGEVDITNAFPQSLPTVYEPSHPMNKYVTKVPSVGMYFARINTSKPPFDDVNLRRALAHSVDFDKTASAVVGGGGIRMTGVLQDAVPCWDPNFKGYAYDVEMAKMYLAQSKYKTAENVPMIGIRSYPGHWNLWFTAWQAQWKENLGIAMNVHVMEQGQELPADINMYAASAGAQVLDPAFLLYGVAHSTGLGSQHIDDELDAKIEALGFMPLDDPGRCETVQEIEREFWDKVYLMPMHQANFHFLVQPWVLGFGTSNAVDLTTLPWWKIGVKDRSAYR